MLASRLQPRERPLPGLRPCAPSSEESLVPSSALRFAPGPGEASSTMNLARMRLSRRLTEPLQEGDNVSVASTPASEAGQLTLEGEVLQEGEMLSVIHDRVLQRISLPPLSLVVDRRYQVTRQIGHGSYGAVCQAFNKTTQEQLAVKHMANVFDCLGDAKRIIREVRFLRTLKHPNIIELYDLMPPADRDFDDITLVFPLMDSDLKQLSTSGYRFTDHDMRYIIYRIMSALHYLHARGVAHRDIKSPNILLSSPGIVKLCDFGLSRTILDPVGPGDPKPPVRRPLTAHVTTRWYRAPEVMLTDGEYDFGVDVWAVGCIMGEMLGSRPGLFPGQNAYDQMKRIVKLIGTPTPEELSYVTNSYALSFMAELKTYPRVSLSRLYPNTADDILDLMSRLLTFDYRKRITARASLLHPAFETVREPATEIPALPECPDDLDAFETRFSLNPIEPALAIPDFTDIEECEPSRTAYQELLMEEVFELDRTNREDDPEFYLYIAPGRSSTSSTHSRTSSRGRGLSDLKLPRDNPQTGTGHCDSDEDVVPAPEVQVRRVADVAGARRGK